MEDAVLYYTEKKRYNGRVDVLYGVLNKQDRGYLTCFGSFRRREDLLQVNREGGKMIFLKN